MDPLSALSLAGAIIQFLDFGSKILSKSYKLYRSGDDELNANKELRSAIGDLDSVIRRLQKPSETLLDEEDPDEDERGLRDLCERCVEVGKEVVARLDKLLVKGQFRPWASIRVAIESSWGESEIKGLIKKLSGYREALETNILVNLRTRLQSQSIQNSSRFDNLDEKTQRIITSLLDGQNAHSQDLQAQTIAVTQLLSRAEVFMRHEHEKTRSIIVNAIQQSKSESSSGAGMPIARDFGQLRANANLMTGKLSNDHEILMAMEQQTSSEEILVSSIEDEILDELHFSRITDRYDEIAEAHRKTLDWIFNKTTSGDQPWSNFTEWLQKGSGIYWINGKAGSGKSTLMRHIFDNSKTKRDLSTWAQGGPLCVASFFFWNSGTVEQRSQLGLLRSLLHDILSQNRQLISRVLPSIWARKYSAALRDRGDKITISLTLPKLLAAFKLLIEQSQYLVVPRNKIPQDGNRSAAVPLQTLQKLLMNQDQTTVPLKICLFIDGLDEYEGDHTLLADLFKNTSMPSNVKVCLSSRPLLAYQDAFLHAPNLQLQDLTVEDISNYVTDSLNENLRFQKLNNEKSSDAAALTSEIVEKAHGVFLWVKLVVRSLLDGLGNRDSIKDLQRRLRLLPSDLEALYQHMLMVRIDPFYLTKTSELIQIVRAARAQGNRPNDVNRPGGDDKTPTPWPLTVLALSFADDDDPDLAVTADIKPMSEADLSSRCQLMADRLNSRCAGLLEVKKSVKLKSGSTQVELKEGGVVLYMHRTARDFLEQPGIWSALLARTEGSGFHPNVSLLKACLLQLKTTSSFDMSFLTRESPSPWHVLTAALEHAEVAMRDTGQPYLEILDQLDLTMETKVKSKLPAYPMNWTSYQSGGFTSPIYWHDTFLSLAVQYNLTAYVDKKLSINKELLTEKRGRPLLEYVIKPERGSVAYGANVRMLTVLIRHGVDWKATNTGIADVWRMAQLPSSMDTKPTQEEFLERYELLSALMQHKHFCDFQKVSDMIAESGMDFVIPLETARLERMLASKNGRAKWGSGSVDNGPGIGNEFLSEEKRSLQSDELPESKRSKLMNILVGRSRHAR